MLIDFLCTYEFSSSDIVNTLKVRKFMYICDKFLKQIRHIPCTPVTMVEMCVIGFLDLVCRRDKVYIYVDINKCNLSNINQFNNKFLEYEGSSVHLYVAGF